MRKTSPKSFANREQKQHHKEQLTLTLPKKLPNVILPPGFECLSLVFLSQLLSRPDVSNFDQSYFFSKNNYDDLILLSPKKFDIQRNINNFLTNQLKDINPIKLYDYTDFGEHPFQSICTELYEKVFSIDFPKVIEIPHSLVDKKADIERKIFETIETSLILYGVSLDTLHQKVFSDSVERVIEKKSFTMRNIWTLYENNHRYFLEIEINNKKIIFANGFIQNHLPSLFENSNLVAVCYFLNNYIKSINNKTRFTKSVSFNYSGEECQIIPKQFDASIIENLNTILKSKYETFNKHDKFEDHVKCALLDSGYFVKFFLNIEFYFPENKNNLHWLSFLSLYPHCEWEKLQSLFNGIDQRLFDYVKTCYLSFVNWIIYVNQILTSLIKNEVPNYNILISAILSIRADNSDIVSFTFLLFSFSFHLYIDEVFKEKKRKVDAFYKKFLSDGLLTFEIAFQKQFSECFPDDININYVKLFSGFSSHVLHVSDNNLIHIIKEFYSLHSKFQRNRKFAIIKNKIQKNSVNVKLSQNVINYIQTFPINQSIF
ncbi:hypothetical protein TRFO_29718 [Tritrichomonas foetus]|uniref:Uncharacterized protein n=1 Tax=Tritrichomonas foetus TaxID=1144522 RepID=A0A1J4JVH8_9EUKA|nr:hypothetical protein TRFO_29718 [Tritrichomonas foetus]|eukprot:OHT03011.1 hypothetical protein TRFO_29718 [Tritrichomonas foetus]